MGERARYIIYGVVHTWCASRVGPGLAHVLCPPLVSVDAIDSEGRAVLAARLVRVSGRVRVGVRVRVRVRVRVLAARHVVRLAGHPVGEGLGRPVSPGPAALRCTVAVTDP